MRPVTLTPQPRRFYDGGPVGGPSDRAAEPRVILERHVDDGLESFALDRAIAYDDRELGELVVPATTGFRTDLTSVPWLFTWLVPRTGAHLPAALLHDGLVGAPDDPPSYVSEEGHVVSRDVADRVFRDAMADTGTGIVRRWVVWSAVATVTIFAGSRAWSARQLWAYRAAATATITVVVVLGTLATVDLFDVSVLLPWMGERAWWSELLGGLAAALAIPTALGLAWARFRVAGVVMGVLLALLLHVTVALLALTMLYRLVETFTRSVPRAAAGAALLVVATSWVVLFGYVR